MSVYDLTAADLRIGKQRLAGLIEPVLLIVFGLGALWTAGCGDGSNASPRTPVTINPVVVSTASRTPRTTTLGVNYWTWMPTYGDSVTGTETLIAALAPAVMRIGGYNNDANTPDPFDNDALDKAVTYARAIGAEPLIQVPHLADISGQSPTADEAAAMVTYANITKGYGIKYFSVGNEPDIYESQGSLTDPTLPAIPGYTTDDFCASATEYVAAMKAADPTIQIVGPDLSNKYQAGNGTYDWLTPILQTCGDLFDIVSIHRYPFEGAQASLPAAEADLAKFRAVIASVRGILTATNQGAKPLALTEMNVVYDATTCVLDASPGTVGSALWLADSVGTAIELGLWTTAVWDISDAAPFALGIIDLPPNHTPRPEYYAYQLYADHFGPTVLTVPTVPAGVSAHASRNQADDATEVILSNWNTTPVGLAFQVTGLAKPPAAATYILPAVSIAAVEIPDTGPASAWSYADAQRLTGSGPQMLKPGASVGPGVGGASGAGASGPGGASRAGPAGIAVGTRCGEDAAVVCPRLVLSSPAITTQGTASGTKLSFGSGPDRWGSYTYAGSGQTAPTVTVTSDGNGIQIAGGFVSPILANDNYEGVGLYFNSASCIDGSAYTGVKFDFSGDLGGCSLSFGASFSGDLSHVDDPTRGACPGTDSSCYGPSFALVPIASPMTFMVPFTSLGAGVPIGELDPTTITAVQWQLGGQPSVTDGGACAANFSVANVAFY